MENKSYLWAFSSLKRRGIFINGSLRGVQEEKIEKRNFVLTKSQPPRVPGSLDFAQNWQNLLLNLYLLQQNSKQMKLETMEISFKQLNFFTKF